MFDRDDKTTLLPARHIRPGSRLNAVPPDAGVLACAGQRPAGALKAGDRVIARDHGALRIGGAASATRFVQAVRVDPGSIGLGRPMRQLILPAGQEILLRDWRARALFGAEQALVPLSVLVDGAFVTALGPQPLRLIALHCPSPHILYVEGLELATAAA